MDKKYDVITFISKYLYFKKKANFKKVANVTKIASMFLKTTFNNSNKVKRVRNYVLK